MHKRVETILRELLNGTRTKHITWEETVDENTFRLLLDSGGILIQRTTEATTPVPPGEFRITFMNKSNTPVESSMSESPKELQLLRDLFVEAQRSALHPDDVLSEIEREVSQLVAGKA